MVNINMTEKKTLCELHHFYYLGNKCPLCEKERIDALVKKYSPKEFKDKEITENDISKLSDKFNVIIKNKKK